MIIPDGFIRLWDDRGDVNNYDWLLAGFDRAKMPLPMRRNMEILPGVYSWDDTTIRFIKKLVLDLNEHPELQPSVDEDMMVGENGVHTDFNALLTTAGYSQTPMSFVPIDNSDICSKLNLPSGFRTPRHREIVYEFFHEVFSNWKPSNIKVPKHSTHGIPCMWNYDPQYKKDCAMFLYQNIDEVLSLVLKHDFDSLAREFGIVFVYNLNGRWQVDPPGKKRESCDKMYAITGGKEGSLIETDKTVRFPDGRTYDNLSATRARVVQGASWNINCILQVVASGHMYSLFERFPKVFHHTDPQEIANDAYAAGDATFSDVSNYDRSIGTFMIDAMLDVMSQYWHPGIVEMWRILMYAPYYYRPMDVSGGKKRGDYGFIGDPLRPLDLPIHAGNRSGHAGTSLMAKIFKVADSLCVIDDTTRDVLGSVRLYLEDKGLLKIRNNGDDEGVIGSKVAVARYRLYRYDNKHGYFSVSPELGQGFSGRLMRWKDKPEALQRLHTPFERTLCPERPIGGKFRRLWPIGIAARIEAIHAHPRGSYAWEIFSRAWHDIMGPVHGEFNNILIQSMNELHGVHYDGLTAIEREVSDDPEKLHYKYTDADLSPEFLAQIVESITPDKFGWALNKYSGNVN